MTWYTNIQPLQEPFDLGADESGREQAVFNVVVMKRPGAAFVKELIQILEDAGVGKSGTDIFGSSQAPQEPEKPPEPGVPDVAILYIRPTGGMGPSGTHDGGAAAYRHPGAQITAKARTWSLAEAKALAAYSALIAVKNQAVTLS